MATIKVDEFTIFKLLRPTLPKRLTNEELFYYQRMQYLRYIPHYKKEVLANRSQFNITDTLIKVLKGGFLKLESPYGSSFVTILPVEISCSIQRLSLRRIYPTFELSSCRATNQRQNSLIPTKSRDEWDVPIPVIETSWKKLKTRTQSNKMRSFWVLSP